MEPYIRFCNRLLSAGRSTRDEDIAPTEKSQKYSLVFPSLLGEISEGPGPVPSYVSCSIRPSTIPGLRVSGTHIKSIQPKAEELWASFELETAKKIKTNKDDHFEGGFIPWFELHIELK
jgi:hypothetical protein